jgi:hypothetical protein
MAAVGAMTVGVTAEVAGGTCVAAAFGEPLAPSLAEGDAGGVVGGEDPSVDVRGLGPTPATATAGDPPTSSGSAGAAINGAPTHAPTTATVMTRAMSGRRSPRFKSGDGAT